MLCVLPWSSMEFLSGGALPTNSVCMGCYEASVGRRFATEHLLRILPWRFRRETLSRQQMCFAFRPVFLSGGALPTDVVTCCCVDVLVGRRFPTTFSCCVFAMEFLSGGALPTKHVCIACYGVVVGMRSSKHIVCVLRPGLSVGRRDPGKHVFSSCNPEVSLERRFPTLFCVRRRGVSVGRRFQTCVFFIFLQ